MVGKLGHLTGTSRPWGAFMRRVNFKVADDVQKRKFYGPAYASFFALVAHFFFGLISLILQMHEFGATQ